MNCNVHVENVVQRYTFLYIQLSFYLLINLKVCVIVDTTQGNDRKNKVIGRKTKSVEFI